MREIAYYGREVEGAQGGVMARFQMMADRPSDGSCLVNSEKGKSPGSEPGLGKSRLPTHYTLPAATIGSRAVEISRRIKHRRAVGVDAVCATLKAVQDTLGPGQFCGWLSSGLCRRVATVRT